MNSPYMGKNWRDFNVVGSYYTDLYDLRIGDYFMEDTYPEVYQVTRVEYRDGKPTVVLSHDLTDNVKDVEWFYDREAGRGYAPTLVKLEPK
jgi:hypothetical protein